MLIWKILWSTAGDFYTNVLPLKPWKITKELNKISSSSRHNCVHVITWSTGNESVVCSRCVTMEAEHGFSITDQLLPLVCSCDGFSSAERPEQTGRKENTQRDSCLVLIRAATRATVRVSLHLRSHLAFTCFQVIICTAATFFTAFYIYREDSATKGGAKTLQTF